ncbi:MAG TPA: hypothetical protein VLB85_03970 [Acidimicrobiia bacterium]|nr:hypothetical protein [Acidimicrobiia bacterium]
MKKSDFVIVLSDPPPTSTDPRVRAQSLAVIESHLRVLGFEIRPTLATRFHYWWRIGRHHNEPRRFTMSDYPNADLESSDLVPLAVIAVEVGQSVDKIGHRFAVAVVTDDIGLRAVPADAARRFFTERADWKARHEEQARRRAEEMASKKPVLPAGAPTQEGLTAVEALMAAEAATGTYSTPKSEFGPGWGNPTQELMDEQFAEGNMRIADRRARAKERRAERLKKDAQR